MSCSCGNCNGSSMLIGPTGATGAAGTNGVDGVDGSGLAFLSGASTSCSNGGTEITIGVDADNDGIIDGASTTFSICNGADGAPGVDATSPLDGFGGGGIIMYDGDITNAALFVQGGTTDGLGIGTMLGWAYCNGLNNTPDLRGLFPLCTGLNQTPLAGDLNPTYALGDIQGENVHGLTPAETPKHSHGGGSLTTPTESTHTHGTVIDWSGMDGDHSGCDINLYGPTPGGPCQGTGTETTSTNSGHNHGPGGWTGASEDGTSSGLTITSGSGKANAHENRPRSRAVHFIKRVS